jgi:hypothetical protein
MTESNDNNDKFERIDRTITNALGENAQSIGSKAEQEKLAMTMEQRLRELGEKASVLGLHLNVHIVVPDRGKPKDVLETELHEFITPHFVRALKAASEAIGGHYFPEEKGEGSIVVTCKAMTDTAAGIPTSDLLGDDDDHKTVH